MSTPGPAIQSGNQSNDNIGDLGRVLSKLSMKSIPTWDASNRSEKTIASHLKSFENAVGGTDLSSEEQARELIASLRGQALTLVENLGDDQRKDFDELKKVLLEVFHKEKPIQILIQEFYGMIWKKKKQTIRQYATALDLTWKKIAKDQTKDDKTSDAILKNRLIDGISAAEPKFGEWLQFTTSADTDFKKLAIEAENKYDVFKANRERVQEHEWEEEPSFFNKEKPDKEGQDRAQKGRKNDQNRISERSEDSRGQNNFFQGQKRDQYDGGRTWRDQRWESQPPNFGRDLEYQARRQSNWGREQSRGRWNTYERGFNQYRDGPRYYPNPRRDYPVDGWSQNNSGRNQSYGFQRRPFGPSPNWGRNQRQMDYQNNGNRFEKQTYQNNQNQHGGEGQRQKGTYAQRNQNVNFLENTSKNL